MELEEKHNWSSFRETIWIHMKMRFVLFFLSFLHLSAKFYEI